MPSEDFSLEGIIFLQQVEQGEQAALYILTRGYGLLLLFIVLFDI
nr:MAG TPA: hypothetical protein [Caudoviricetes sp.]